ncbi:hypothetical protein EIP86_009887 [Pleurotus ostreatoroseus]|nr:hypothetical protein EIP86_009887 [Pleurotus ostreatoroseus]
MMASPRPVNEDIRHEMEVDGDEEAQRSVSDATANDDDEPSQPSTQVASRVASVHEVKDEKHAFLVHLEAKEEPKNFSVWRKWIIIEVVCMGALCSTCASSMAAYADDGIAATFHVGTEVAVLGVTTFLVGLGKRTATAVTLSHSCMQFNIGQGPLFVGPLSEVYGRSPVYIVSFFVFFALSWAVCFAPDIATYVIFRYLTGLASSAFLSVAGGTVSDLFVPSEVGIPMAIYTLHPFIGTMLGPVLSGFINQNTNWRWTYWTLQIWIFVQLLAIIGLVPETFEPVLLKRKAKKLRKATGDSRYYAPLDHREISMVRAVLKSCWTPFKLLLLDRMALLLDIWTALVLGIIYLAFEAWPFIFIDKHGFSLQQNGMACIGLGVGMIFGCALNIGIIIWNRRRFAKNNIKPTPETSLIQGMIGGVVVPASLFWLALTTFKHVHWIAPIIASAFYGVGFYLCFASTFTYLVAAFRPIAASAMAGNAFVRACFAGAFPLFASQMYEGMGTIGATCLLAGVMTVAAPLPFIFYRIGARLRAKSPMAAK